MNALRALSCLLLLLSLTAVAPAVPPPTPKDTPAVAVVRQFLADRAEDHLDAAYELLSASSRKVILADEFAEGGLPNLSDTRRALSAFLGILDLFGDTHNVRRNTFSVVGPDTAAPGGVLVRVAAAGGTAAMLRIATVTDPGASAPRLDFYISVERTDPVQFALSKENAKRAASQSNLKQLSLGLTQYLQDNGETMMDADKWVDALLPYVKNKMLFRDPSAPAGEEYSYAFNRALSGVRLGNIKDPSATVLLFESTKGIKNASDTGQSVPKPGRHLGGTDYAFADGHVKWLPDGTAPSFALTGK